MPQEKDSALTKVLDLLGLTGVHPAEGNDQTNSKSSDHSPQPASDDLPPNSVPSAVAGIMNGSNSTWGQTSTSPANASQNSQSSATVLSDPHAISTLPVIDTGYLDIPITEQYPPTDDHSDNSLTNCDWTLDFGTCITPPSPEIQDIGIEPPQLPQLPGEPFEPFEGPPEPFEPSVLQVPPSLDNDTRSTEEIEDLIDELSDRMGTLRFGPGGKARFYGPTSTFNLADVPVSVKTQTRRTVDDLDDADYDSQVPLSLEEHLLNLYFAWQDPSFHVVDRELFEKGKAAWNGKEETPFYSEALCYAM
jgi:hypothetical protein